MKATIVFILMLGSATLACWAKEPATTQVISNTRYGRRVITVSSSDYAPDFNELSAFLNQRAAELGPTVLNIPADKMGLPVLMLGVSFGMNGGSVDLTLSEANQADARPAATEFLNAMVTATQKFVGDEFDQRKDRDLMLARRDLDVCDAQVREANDNLRMVRAKLSDTAGRADVSVAGLTAAVSRLEEEKEKLELDVLGKKARQEALEKEIANMANELQAAAKSDPVLQELAKVVEVRQAKLDQVRKMHDSGTVSDGEVQDAIVALAEARAKLAERQRGGGAGEGAAGSAETLAALSRERVNLSIDLRELQVRLEYVEKHLPPLRSAMNGLDELQRAESVLKSAQDVMATSTNRYNELRRRLETLDPPQVLLKLASDRETAVIAPGAEQ